MDELHVECPQRSFGCSYTCQRQWLATHVKDECQFVEVRCYQDQCEEVVLRKDVGKHTDTCERRMVQCEACGARVQFINLQVSPWKQLLDMSISWQLWKSHYALCPAEDAACPDCDTVLPRGDMSNHASNCLERVVSCEQAVHGCSWTGPRRALSTLHQHQCPYEAIKGFFALNVTRMSALETENTALRWRVEELENALRSTSRDLQTVKLALGPWFRPDGSHVPLRPSPPSEPAPRVYARRRLSNALNSAMFGLSQDSRSSVDPDGVEPTPQPSPATSPLPADPFAQFFPPPNNQSSQSLHPSDAFALGQLADVNYPRTAPNSQVAPLNLNTTLEGSLMSLRSSVITLAASLDSETRRHDIALTTESLRVNEEVMSLRAIVQGVRMQVHHMMMDRNSQVTGRDDEGPAYNYSHARATAIEPWTSSVRYLNHHPPVHRPISIGTTTHVQTTKL